MTNESIVIQKTQNPGCLLQLVWFAFVGWWLGQAWIAVAWILMVTIIGIPLGVMMLNMLPKVIALRDPSDHAYVSTQHGWRPADVPQVNFLVRAIYFVLIGWWFSALWMEVAYAISLTVIGLPVGFWMFDRVPAIVSLKR